MSDFQYHVTGRWADRRRGTVDAEGVNTSISFSAPPEFQGETGFWTPEHFFAAAIASCFVTTFKAIADFSKFEYLGLEVNVEATLEKGEGGYSVSKAAVQPLLTIAPGTDQERGMRLLEKAERACLISRSIRTQIELRPSISFGERELAPAPTA